MQEELITDVHASVWAMVRKDYSSYLAVLAFVVAVVVTLAIVTRQFAALFLILIPVAACYSYLFRKAHKNFMQQFARRNGLSYLESSHEIDSLPGALFKLGHSQSLFNIVAGEHSGFPMRLFNYSYVTGSGKHRRVHMFTVCEMMVKAELPSIKLIANSYLPDWMLGTAIRGGKMNLEQDFEKRFSLFVPDGYETEALQIFTREFLTFMITRAPDFSIELVEDKLYIYDDRYITKKDELDKLYEVQKHIIIQLGPYINRLADDFEALKPYYG